MIWSSVHTPGVSGHITAILQILQGSQFDGRIGAFLGSINVVVPGKKHEHCFGGHPKLQGGQHEELGSGVGASVGFRVT